MNIFNLFKNEYTIELVNNDDPSKAFFCWGTVRNVQQIVDKAYAVLTEAGEDPDKWSVDNIKKL